MYCEEDVPCASLAVESIIRLGGVGLAWGLFYGSHEADKKDHCACLGGTLVYFLVSRKAYHQPDLCIFPLRPRCCSGLVGSSRVLFNVRAVGKCGILCGLAAGTFSATRCKVQQLRKQKGWLNSTIAGAVTGAALAARTRSSKQILTTATVVSAAASVADYLAI